MQHEMLCYLLVLTCNLLLIFYLLNNLYVCRLFHFIGSFFYKLKSTEYRLTARHFSILIISIRNTATLQGQAVQRRWTKSSVAGPIITF